MTATNPPKAIPAWDSSTSTPVLLPDDPVDNLDQPPLAAVLTETLGSAGKLTERSLTATNFAICVRVGQRTAVKAPDWVYVAETHPLAPGETRRSYTPGTEGDVPFIVLEFLSATEGGEYSAKPTYPYGKWFFYEQILQVPIYGIFDPVTGAFELYRLQEGRYQPASAETETSRYWITELELFLGVWEGTWQYRDGFWLRGWTADHVLIPLSLELVIQERERAKQEYERAEQERERAEQAEAQLAEFTRLLQVRGISLD